MQFYCQNTIRLKKDTKLCLRVEKWSRSVGITYFLNFYTKLAESSFLCRFPYRICQCVYSSTIRFVPCAFFTNKQFCTCANAFPMSSLSGRMNIARV